MIRRTLSFIVASALFLAGAALAVTFLFTPGGVPLGMLYGAGVFGFLGAAWLWADFIAPLFKRESEG